MATVRAGGPSAENRLKTALVVQLAVFLSQAAGGAVAHSLALYANAGHLAADMGSIGLAYLAARWEDNPPHGRHSYGYRRGAIVAALLNAAFLMVLGASLVVLGVLNAFPLHLHPRPAQPLVMLLAAGAAFVFNLALSGLLDRHRHDDLNVRSVFWHVLGDSLGSLAVVLAALAMRWTGWNGWDGLAAAAVGLLMTAGALGIGRHAVEILMEATPRQLDAGAIQTAMESVPGVNEVHHLHIWALAPRYYALSAHLQVSATDLREAQATVDRVQALLAERFHIGHTALQVETPEHQDRREWDG